MRILFCTFPGLGHFFPHVPLAWAARAAGHEVLFATAGPALEACGGAGLPAADAAPGLDLPAMFRQRRAEVMGSERAVQAAEFVRRIRDPFSEENRKVIASWMAGMGDRLSDRTVEAARSWRADLVVRGPIDVAGSLAAALLGVPVVTQGFGLHSPVQSMSGDVEEAMRPTIGRHGLEGRLPGPAATIDTCPPSMSEADRPPAWHMRYVPYNGGGALPEWLVAPTGRPRVCLTLGSAVPRAWGVSTIAGVVEAVRDLDADVVLALGDVDASGLGELPPNVRVAGWVPLSALARECAAIVHHGGAGTTMNALVAGVPQLVLPHAADQYANAAAVVRRGVGLTHRIDEIDAPTAGRSLRSLLTEPSFAAAAAEVRDEIAAATPPAEVIPRLAALAA